MWKIYLDTCCLNRPFDDQTQDRVRLEAEAVLIILARIGSGDWQWIASAVVREEIGETPSGARRFRLASLFADADAVVLVGQAEVARGEQLEAIGFRDYDALHLACAESGGAEVFLTTDDRLLRLARRRSRQLNVRVENPVAWLAKVLTV